mmetsp:Transcript_12566/g.45844  ORF Transcript_12566/g.45844 Transcript_12566/m.45844 type:complete len:312 (+) Transcript_12566:215-1150(+)
MAAAAIAGTAVTVGGAVGQSSTRYSRGSTPALLGRRRAASSGRLSKPRHPQQQGTLPRNARSQVVRCSATQSAHATSIVPPSTGLAKAPVSPFELEGWVHNSVRDIVRNLDNAPFLYFYGHRSSGNVQPLVKGVNPAINSQEWERALLSSLQHGKAAGELPRAVMFVHKLPNAAKTGRVHPAFERTGPVEAGSTCGEGHRHGGDSSVVDSNTLRHLAHGQHEDCHCGATECDGSCSETSLYGLVIQGVGATSLGGTNGHACYLLETTKCVCSSVQQECFKFSLTRARCLAEMSTEEQLLSSWLCSPSLHMI